MMQFIFKILKNRKAVFLVLILIFSGLSTFSQPGKVQSKKKDNLKTSQKNIPPVADSLHKSEPDSDGDGIPDSIDKCPDEKGVIQYDGCPMPDSDNDGIADDLDECPTEAGPIKYKGCPAGDRDGDKINDDEDKCPDIPGLARFDGCPTKDTDGDGVNDDDDNCPDVTGPVSNKGCPVFKISRKTLKTNKQKLKNYRQN